MSDEIQRIKTLGSKANGEELEHKEFQGLSVVVSRGMYALACDILREVSGRLVAAGFVRTEGQTSYGRSKVEFVRGKHSIAARIREACHVERNKEGTWPSQRFIPTGELTLLVKGNWISELTFRGDLKAKLDKVVPRVVAAIERRERGWAELEAKLQQQQQAVAAEKARVEEEQRKKEEARRAWYDTRVAKLNDGQLTTGLPDLDFVMRRWAFLPETVRAGIVAMVHVMPASADEAAELGRLTKDAAMSGPCSSQS